MALSQCFELLKIKNKEKLYCCFSYGQVMMRAYMEKNRNEKVLGCEKKMLMYIKEKKCAKHDIEREMRGKNKIK